MAKLYLETRIRILEDIEAIKMQGRYWHCIIQGLPEGVVD